MGFAERAGANDPMLYGLFVCFGTLFIYNFQRLFKIKIAGEKTPWLVWVKDNSRLLLALSISSGMLSLICLYLLEPKRLLPLLILGTSIVVGLFYVIRIRGYNMRGIPFLKIHLIAFTWSLLVSVFSLLNAELDLPVVSVFFAHYLYVLAVTIPFDIRDLKYDAPEMKTLPQILGVNGSKLVAVAALVGYVFLAQSFFPELSLKYSFWIVMSITVVLIINTKETSSDWYCAGLIDGSIGLLGLVYMLA